MEENSVPLTFPAIFNETVRKFGNHNAYAFAGEKPKTYFESQAEIRALTALLENIGIKPSDKVALLSHNMPNWSSAYFSITFMGAVVVPILPDFSATEVANILIHSGAKALFISTSLLPRLEGFKSDDLKTAILIEDFSVLFSDKRTIVFDPFAEPKKTYEVAEDDLASIIYTSGTTGRSKGVMLTHKNIVFNAFKGKVIQPIDETTSFYRYCHYRTLMKIHSVLYYRY